jgi:hypothetical protein
VSYRGPFTWSRPFGEFHCPECGSSEAHRSRPRGFFEKYILSFMMRPVRCDRCSRRSYALKSVLVQERTPPASSQPQSRLSADSKPESRIA